LLAAKAALLYFLKKQIQSRKMSFRNDRPRNRRARRQETGGPARRLEASKSNLPLPFRFLSNARLFAIVAVIAGVALVAGAAAAAIFPRSSTNDNGSPQGNEAEDVPIDQQTSGATPDATAQPAATIKRYTAPPGMTIDASKTYKATLTTGKGDIAIELYPEQAPEAVNAFVFLAREGYYNGTAFMQLVKNADGSRFYAQAGDPTETGLGTPGFSVRKEQTSQPFVRGAVGMGGSAENSNGGQFFISYGDYPALNGRYTIFGKIVSGLDVLDRLSLLDLTTDGAHTPGDEIQSVTISES
jgi:cyclophilin family peptidyl-prolyl cis-trans isomerase